VTVLYDPFSSSAHENPYPTYRTLRDEHPVYHNEERDLWALSRFSDVQSAARDWKTFSSAAGIELDATSEVFGPGHFIDSDPPRHDELRHVIRREFAPKSLRAREGWIRAKVRELLGPMLESGKGDLAQELAWPLPVAVIASLLGLRQEDQALLEQWSAALSYREPDSNELPQSALDATSAMREYFRDVIDERRRKPEEDLISEIVAAEAEGRMRPEEVLGMCFLVFVAGTETTGSLISNSLLLLARHPDQRARLAASPADIPAAIEEILRYESPVQVLGRTTTRDVELHGTVVPHGARVLLVYGSANRDERRFDDPDRLDLRRTIPRHLAFGEGLHFCLGAPLARLEAKVALEEVLSRVPEYEVNGKVERFHMHTTRGLKNLPAVF
jgi:cytochrome P450